MQIGYTMLRVGYSSEPTAVVAICSGFNKGVISSFVFQFLSPGSKCLAFDVLITSGARLQKLSIFVLGVA